jgi:hypothetical protein
MERHGGLYRSNQWDQAHKNPENKSARGVFLRLVLVPRPLIHVLVFGIFLRLGGIVIYKWGVPFRIEA